MQIPFGTRVSDVCPFCYEHLISEPCPEYDAWAESQYWALLDEIGCDELRADGTCIHSGHMAQVEKYL